MKKLLFITLLIPILSFSQTWQWAKGIKGNSQDYGIDLAMDASGNIYYTGSFSSSFIVFGTDTLRKQGTDNNVFITKFDSTGNVLWAKQTKSTGQDNGFSLAIDNSNNIFLTGEYQGPTIVFETDTLYNSGWSLQDFFLAKYNSSGNLLWVKVPIALLVIVLP